MRRWILGLFALHFLVNVALFAFGQVDVRSPVPIAEGPSHQALQPADPANQRGDLLGQAPDHGLTDAQPDLPEMLGFGLGPLTPPGSPSTPVTAPNRSKAAPPPDGPQRPPRMPVRA